MVQVQEAGLRWSCKVLRCRGLTESGYLGSKRFVFGIYDDADGGKVSNDRILFGKQIDLTLEVFLFLDLPLKIP